jgi:hypothetical protein
MGIDHNTPRPQTLDQNVFQSMGQRSEAMDGLQHSWVLDLSRKWSRARFRDLIVA